VGAAAGIGVLFPIGRGRFLLAGSLAAATTLFVLAMIGSGAVAAVLTLIWMLTTALGLGELVLWAVARRLTMGPLARLLLAWVLGLGAQSLLTLGLGSLGGLRPAAIWILFSALALPGLLRACRAGFPQWIAALRELPGRWKTADLRLTALASGMVLVCLAGAMVRAFAPATSSGALTYHVGVPAIYAGEHRVVEVPEEFRSYWAQNAEMLYTEALTLADQAEHRHAAIAAAGGGGAGGDHPRQIGARVRRRRASGGCADDVGLGPLAVAQLVVDGEPGVSLLQRSVSESKMGVGEHLPQLRHLRKREECLEPAPVAVESHQIRWGIRRGTHRQSGFHGAAGASLGVRTLSPAAAPCGHPIDPGGRRGGRNLVRDGAVHSIPAAGGSRDGPGGGFQCRVRMAARPGRQVEKASPRAGSVGLCFSGDLLGFGANSVGIADSGTVPVPGELRSGIARQLPRAVASCVWGVAAPG
jgi:hypothetical protein